MKKLQSAFHRAELEKFYPGMRSLNCQKYDYIPTPSKILKVGRYQKNR